MDYVRFVALSAVALLATSAPVPAAATPDAPLVAGPDIRELDRTRFTLDGHALPDHPRYRPQAQPRTATATGTPAVGTERQWLGLDDNTGSYYPKQYRLRAVGRHIEVWVADDIQFPKNDCRKDPVAVTDGQVTELIREFDDTIYPREIAAFSTPPARDGSKASRPGDYTGDGDKTVTLVDNIRDDNYVDYPKASTYIAGFFSPQLNELFDRNVMTIDAYDWKHRLGPAPTDEPTADLCTSRPARPSMYEGTFAHEWQHLLEYYTDPAEVTWVNEGLSDFAQTLTGYVDARATVYDRGYDSHLICFQGFGLVKTRYNANPRVCGGPQNSLNLWDEGAPGNVLADYGNAYQFMLYLYDRFGLGTISLLHRDGIRQGLAGVQAALPTGTSLYDVVHDYQTTTLVDKIVGGDGGTMTGVPRDQVTAASLRSTVDLAAKSAYDTPGAAPNGADYVPLPTPLRSVSFDGAKTLPPLPTGWSIAGKALFSGSTSNRDAHAVLPVTVPTKTPVLRMETSYDLEQAYDFGYVTVSTDQGRSYTAVPGDRTVRGPLGPALTGTSGKVVTATYDLKPYAGKKVLLGLRYVTDRAVNKAGWRVTRLTLAGHPLTTGTLTGWRSPTAVAPTPVHGWHAVLVGLDGARAQQVSVDKFALLKAFPQVVAIVSYDEPTETITRYAPYHLYANGTLQPGGTPPPSTTPTPYIPTPGR